MSGSEILHREQTGNVKDVKLSFCSVFGSSEKSPKKSVWTVMLSLKGPDLQWWSGIKQRKKQTARVASCRSFYQAESSFRRSRNGERGGRESTDKDPGGQVKSSHVI